jgi:ribosomal protein L24E
LTHRLGLFRLLGSCAVLVFALGALSEQTASADPSTTTTTTTPAPSPTAAYWLVATDGGIFSFGGAQFYGSTGAIALNKPIVGMAPSHDGLGYWLVASDGGIFSFGDAQFYGSTGSIKLNKPIVGMAPTPSGKGYWLVATDGGVFSFGDAQFYGSTGSIKLNQPVVGMAPIPNGTGYWLVASDGGIFSFGNANFFGSTGSLKLNKPIISMIADPNGGGYLLVASDGGTFSFGSAPFYGSLGGIPLKNPIVAAAVTPQVTGYWFTDSHGEVSAFGKATYYGSAPTPLNKPIVGMAEAPGTGNFSGGTYPSGTYGYDISKWQCSQMPTGDHTIGIVQVDGASSSFTNPCLAQEAQWAGGGLNLYTFLTYGTAQTGPGFCQGDTSCNYGYAAGLTAYQDAVNAGVNVNVGWWLDVETASPAWSSNTAENAQLVMGALAALHNQEGIANVGIYASPGVWNNIVGNYQPSVPYWMADYLPSPSGPGSCADISRWTGMGKLLPTGPLQIVQYNSTGNPQFDDDYAC